jgi:hypothetical protein
LFLKFDLLKEFHEVRSGHISTVWTNKTSGAEASGA